MANVSKKLKSTLKNVKKSKPISKSEPVWKGPEVDGVTQSMINSFLFCRRRFRVNTITGLKSADHFNKGIEYGNMWHVAEEEFARTKGADDGIERAIIDHAKKLIQKYPLAKDEIIKWHHVCRRQFRVYIDYWAKNPESIERSPIVQEYKFKVPYILPNGRTVFLRGKFDGVDFIGKGRTQKVFLQENKTKGDIDEISLQRQLTFDLQTMYYLVALQTMINSKSDEQGDFPVYWPESQNSANLGGVRYNVVRRPLSGGKGSIRQHQPSKSNPKGESAEEFYERLMNDYIKAEPSYWFMRWTVAITQSDIQNFKERFLDPFLMTMCQWYDEVTGNSPLNWHDYQTPFGIYNPIAERGVSDLDEYLASGSTVGLEPVTTLFPELEDE